MAATKRPLTPRQREGLDALASVGGNQSQCAQLLKIRRQSLQKIIISASKRGWSWRDFVTQLDMPEWEIEEQPSGEIPIDSLLARRREQDSVQDLSGPVTRLIPINLRDDSPLGILHFGDPHLDDDRTRFAELEADMALVCETDGLYAANLGDTTNNWCNRLARLFANQSTKARDAVRLAEWFLCSLGDKLLWTIGGNHDLWSEQGKDPLEWFHRQIPGYYAPAEARFELRFPGGARIKVCAHHDFKGSSIWNVIHAQTRAARLYYRDDLLISGHRHISGYGMIAHVDGTVSHLVQCGSYKRHDDFGLKIGATPHHISPSVLTVIDPAAGPAGRVLVYHDRNQGAAVLAALRSRSCRS
jgi:hypothetical protein